MNADVGEQLLQSRKWAAATLALCASVATQFFDRRELRNISSALPQFTAMKVIENAATSALQSAEAISEVQGEAAHVALARNSECIEYLHTLAAIGSQDFDRAIRLAELQEE